jgi:hypothetical protein
MRTRWCSSACCQRPLRADAVFDKLDAHLEIDQALPQDFFVNFYASG